MGIVPNGHFYGFGMPGYVGIILSATTVIYRHYIFLSTMYTKLHSELLEL